MPSGPAAASISRRTGWGARAVASIQSRSASPGDQLRSLLAIRASPVDGVGVDQTSRPAPKYNPAARIVPAAMVPTLMYRSPVADSIDRVRAVWTAAQLTMSGNTSPTSRRSHTNSAQGPTSAANAGVPAGPAPSAIQATNSPSCTASAIASQRDSPTSGASGSRGVTRYQWPRTIAAQTPPSTAARRTSSIRSGALAQPPPPQLTAANRSARPPATRPATASAA